MSDNPQDSLHFMLGEMRADIKQLLAAQHNQAGRVTDVEKRVTRLEHTKTRIGVFVGSVGVVVPSIFAYLLHKFGG